jgi:sugar/nucleoside kinase (ribokinase family)
VPEVLVTFGFRGAAVACEGESGHVAAQVVRDIDPTGAGDGFLAGYAHARAQGAEPLAAARTACEHVSALFSARAQERPVAPA